MTPPQRREPSRDPRLGSRPTQKEATRRGGGDPANGKRPVQEVGRGHRGGRPVGRCGEQAASQQSPRDQHVAEHGQQPDDDEGGRLDDDAPREGGDDDDVAVDQRRLDVVVGHRHGRGVRRASFVASLSRKTTTTTTTAASPSPGRPSGRDPSPVEPNSFEINHTCQLRHLQMKKNGDDGWTPPCPVSVR